VKPRPQIRPLFNAPPFDDDDFEGEAFVAADEVPDELLDVPPVPDGDDRKVALGPLSQDDPEPLMATPYPPHARARIVPLRRPIHPGMRGKDVVATKRALSHAGYLRWPKRWSLIAGPQWKKALQRFQKQHGIPATGGYGIATHHTLVKLGHFDKWGAYLMAQAPRPTPKKPAAMRDKIVANSLYWYHVRNRVNYTQTARRMTIVRERIRKLPFGGTIWEDCSSFATGVYFEAGAPDPNGRHYNETGWTGTLRRQGKLAVGPPKPADLNFYGVRPDFSHVTIAAGAKTGVSHGSNPGPYLVAIHYRPDFVETRDYFS
jgi:peptidoglycan hydrolase-like protein with peptidoglycan-binding domain